MTVKELQALLCESPKELEVVVSHYNVDGYELLLYSVVDAKRMLRPDEDAEVFEIFLTRRVKICPEYNREL